MLGRVDHLLRFTNDVYEHVASLHMHCDGVPHSAIATFSLALSVDVTPPETAPQTPTHALASRSRVDLCVDGTAVKNQRLPLRPRIHGHWLFGGAERPHVLK